MLTHQFISELIAATRTDTGHTVRCRLDQATYPKGIIVTDDQLAAVNITRGAFHGEWNYTIAPRTTELVEPSPEPIAVIIAVRPLRFRTRRSCLSCVSYREPYKRAAAKPRARRARDRQMPIRSRVIRCRFRELSFVHNLVIVPIEHVLLRVSYVILEITPISPFLAYMLCR